MLKKIVLSFFVLFLCLGSQLSFAESGDDKQPGIHISITRDPVSRPIKDKHYSATHAKNLTVLSYGTVDKMLKSRVVGIFKLNGLKKEAKEVDDIKTVLSKSSYEDLKEAGLASEVLQISVKDCCRYEIKIKIQVAQ